MLKNIKTFSLLMLVAISTSACLQINTGSSNELLPDGGLYISSDEGMSWQQKTEILETGGVARNFSMAGAVRMFQDPNNADTLYYGTYENGLLYSYDKGEGWTLAKNLGKGTVSGIAIDYDDVCVVYAGIGNKLYKTEDCNRTWKEIFTDNTSYSDITEVITDHFNKNNIYLALSTGDLVKSTDKGKSWKTLYRFGKRIHRLYLHPGDSRVMYANINNDGIYRTDDGGTSWEEITKEVKDMGVGTKLMGVEMFVNDLNLYFLATDSGILRSNDGAKTWEVLELLPANKKADIKSIAVNPQDVNKIFYVTSNTFYRTSDGGKNWSPKKIGSTREAKILKIDNKNPEILYLAMWIE